jgi:hypothetical protein
VALYDVIRTWATCPWNAYPTASALMLALLYVDRRRVWADAPAHLCVAGGEDREPISRSHQAVRLRPCPRGHHSIEGALTRGLGG